MPYDPNVPPDWQSVTTEADEIWQCREGELLVTASNPASGSRTQGIVLDGDDNAGIRVASGKTVWYRKVGDGNCILARESFE